MSNFILMTDSSTDLPKTYYETNDVELIPIRYVLDGVEYKDDAGVSMDYKEFYARMRAGSMSTTSLINRDEYTQAFERFLSEGKDVLYISISSGISGSYQSAVGAAEELSEKYPHRKLYICDGLLCIYGRRGAGTPCSKIACCRQKYRRSSRLGRGKQNERHTPVHCR
ncbi:MAG: DegV family protein [Eubacteriales bacterium]